MKRTLRDNLLTALRGDCPERIPFTLYDWNIPADAAGARLRQRGLTGISASEMFRETTSRTTLSVREQGSGADRLRVATLTTGHGTLIEETAFDPSYNSPWIQRHFAGSMEDLPALLEYFNDCSHTADYEPWRTEDRRLGDGGINLGYLGVIPLVDLWVKYLGPELWCEAMLCETERFDELHEALVRHYLERARLVAASPAEVIWLGDNITAVMISPDAYRKYCLPVYRQVCDILHEAGKITFAHYDGNNAPLLELIGQSPLKVIEAYTPLPMGDVTVRQGMESWPDKVVSLNFPGNLFASATETIQENCREYMAQGLAAGEGSRFVVGCTEKFNPVWFEHAFTAIADAMDEFQTEEI